MQTVSERREIDAPPEAVRAALADRDAFMRAGGFDEVTVDGDSIHLANSVGLLTIELDLVAVDDPDAEFAYEQADGIFSSMVTRFTVGPSPDGDGSTVVGTTEFALDASIVGPILDATIIKRQRRRELAGHFEYLERVAMTERSTPES